MRRLLWVFVLLFVAVVLAWLVSAPTTTVKTYHTASVQPVGLAPLTLVASSSPAPSVHAITPKEQKAICKKYPKRCLSQTIKHYKVKRTRDRACNGGETFKMVGIAVGQNKLINDIVHGAAIFQACVDKANPLKFADTWFTWDKHSSWLWKFEGMTVQANHTGWCSECYSQYHYWRLQFEWFHGFNVFGQEIGWHYDNYLTCTVRASAVPKGRWTCS